MKLDPSKYYRMPLSLGPAPDPKALKLNYPHVETLVFQYLTETEAVSDLLPGGYLPGKEPIVTVMFSKNNGLSFMAGGGFQSAAILLSARFDGVQDHLEGDYIVAMFIDDAWPIIRYRDDLGIPGIHADISNIKLMPDGRLRCEASHLGHMLFGLDIPPLRGQLGVVRAVAARQFNARPWLGYKYIPSLEGPPDASYPTAIYYQTKLDKLWMGKKASLRFGIARYEDIGVVKNLLDALATLTIIKPVQVVHSVGSAVLRYDISRRLR